VERPRRLVGVGILGEACEQDDASIDDHEDGI
jgi:hypothetical protein